MRICKPIETSLIFGQGGPSMMGGGNFASFAAPTSTPAPTPAASSVSATMLGGNGIGGGSDSSPPSNHADATSLFGTGVTNGQRNDGNPLGWGCGDKKTDSIVPDRAFGIDLTPACRAHDIAYETCGVSKSQADAQFSQDISTTCKEQGGNALTCGVLSGIYGGAVSALGQGAYDAAQAANGCTNDSNTSDQSNTSGYDTSGAYGDSGYDGNW